MNKKEKEVLPSGIGNTSTQRLDIVKYYVGKCTTLRPGDIKVLYYLAKNGASPQMEIGQALNLADARAHIRNLRGAGVPIADYKQAPPHSQRKIYFIKGL